MCVCVCVAYAAYKAKQSKETRDSSSVEKYRQKQNVYELNVRYITHNARVDANDIHIRV